MEATSQASLESTLVTKSTVEDLGAGYFNPLIGYTPTETCGNISDVMQTLFEVIKNEEIDFHGVRPGLLLIIRTVWAAAQHTGNSSLEGAA